ncbi:MULTISPECIES: choline-binding transcriptional repressor BetI [Mesorhizobium]|uniref:HTH-type transcriptional regulator BetI n=1 Tax=Mesorhizobium denitrificans TaxID=2294114 RepID=A0A371XHV5_9HYPH|nr:MULTISPECIES: transcriptional regulator BetI [Mesorhizobium]RFC68793.1 transcriptional regulator BetI [Mesorhizobium denitrificans]
MPKLGMPPLRRKELIDAAILTIGERGTLDVTMTDIAGRAGVSSALAHHYFGAKDELLQATMRQLLADLTVEMQQALGRAASPRERISAIVNVNFSVGQFRPEVVAAWLAFYVEAQRSPPLRRLLRIYVRRLRSNLMSGLTPLVSRNQADIMSEGIAALIDGFYIRRALKDGLPNPRGAAAVIEHYVKACLSSQPA